MTNELATIKTAITLPSEAQFRHDIQAINSFQKIVRATMVEGLDYGVIPGTDKPTLLKPGAEKMAKLLQLSDSYEVIEKTEDWDKPLFYYQIKCSLKTIGDSVLISEGVGSCNSMEARYRWRVASRKCPTCGVEAIIEGKKEYGGGFICFKKKGGCGAKFAENDTIITGQKTGRVPNDDIYSQVNTILKMAKKRALVDASLSAGRLSDIFTQDVEDLPDMPPMRSPDIKAEVIEGEVSQPAENLQTVPKTAPESKSDGLTGKQVESVMPGQKLMADMAKANWKEATAIGYFRNTLKVVIPSGDNFVQAWGKLNEQQRAAFEQKMDEMAQASGR